jgi:hypothetical protein
LGLPFEELIRQAELIVLGVVLDEKLAAPGTASAGLENHTISVEKVLKGTYNTSKVGVITESEIMEDSPQFNVGERTILFLYQKPLFGDKPSGNDYTVVNLLQGKYDVDDNGQVGGLDLGVNGMSIVDFEKKITNALASPKTNNTHISNDADSYRNDTDMIYSNDSDTAEMLRYKNFTK